MNDIIVHLAKLKRLNHAPEMIESPSCLECAKTPTRKLYGILDWKHVFSLVHLCAKIQLSVNLHF